MRSSLFVTDTCVTVSILTFPRKLQRLPENCAFSSVFPAFRNTINTVSFSQEQKPQFVGPCTCFSNVTKKNKTYTRAKKNSCCAESYTQITTDTQTHRGPGARKLQPSVLVLLDKKGKELQATAVTTKQVVPLCNTTHGVKLLLLLLTKTTSLSFSRRRADASSPWSSD